MFEEFYGMYEPKEQEVVALIKRCIGGGYHNKGDFWGMTVVTLGMVFCDTGKVSPKEERLEWPVTNEERDGERGWGRFRNEQYLPSEDPPDEGRMGAKPGGAALVHLRGGQGS